MNNNADTLANQPVIGYVNAYRLNVRACPQSTCTIITSIERHKALSVLGRTTDSEWLKIDISNVCIGWVYARYVQLYTDTNSLPIIT